MSDRTIELFKKVKLKQSCSLMFLSILFTFYFTACQSSAPIKQNTTNVQTKQNIYKDDYLQACTLISKNYIYLERKLEKSRELFLNECKEYSDQMDWSGGKVQFIDEIRKLMAQFGDGHFDWSLNDEMQLNTTKYLGFTATMHSKNKVYVEKVYPQFTDKLSVGDEIIKWNGEDINKEIERIGKLIPQSTESATIEAATRFLSIEISFKPLRKEFKPVTISIKNQNGKISDVTLEWNDSDISTNWEKLL